MGILPDGGFCDAARHISRWRRVATSTDGCSIHSRHSHISRVCALATTVQQYGTTITCVLYTAKMHPLVLRRLRCARCRPTAGCRKIWGSVKCLQGPIGRPGILIRNTHLRKRTSHSINVSPACKGEWRSRNYGLVNFKIFARRIIKQHRRPEPWVTHPRRCVVRRQMVAAQHVPQREHVGGVDHRPIGD